MCVKPIPKPLHQNFKFRLGTPLSYETSATPLESCLSCFRVFAELPCSVKLKVFARSNALACIEMFVKVIGEVSVWEWVKTQNVCRRGARSLR